MARSEARRVWGARLVQAALGKGRVGGLSASADLGEREPAPHLPSPRLGEGLYVCFLEGSQGGDRLSGAGVASLTHQAPGTRGLQGQSRDTGSPRTGSLRCSAHSTAGPGPQPDPGQRHSPDQPHLLLDAVHLVSASRTASFAFTARPLTDPHRGRHVTAVSTHSRLHGTVYPGAAWVGSHLVQKARHSLSVSPGSACPARPPAQSQEPAASHLPASAKWQPEASPNHMVSGLGSPLLCRINHVLAGTDWQAALLSPSISPGDSDT